MIPLIHQDSQTTSLHSKKSPDTMLKCTINGFKSKRWNSASFFHKFIPLESQPESKILIDMFFRYHCNIHIFLLVLLHLFSLLRIIISTLPQAALSDIYTLFYSLFSWWSLSVCSSSFCCPSHIPYNKFLRCRIWSSTFSFDYCSYKF